MRQVHQSRTGRPPAWAELLLRTMLAERSQDMIAGDLLEEYRESVVPAVGAFRARVWYLRQVMSFLNVADTMDVAGKISKPLLWAAAVAFIVYVVVFALPSATEIPFSDLLFAFSGIVLIVGGATAIRTMEHRRPVFRICCAGLVSFAAVTVVVMNAQPFRPIIIMAAFLVIATTMGFQGAWRTGLVRMGIVTAVATGTASAVLLYVTVDFLNHPHPPLLAALALPVMAAIAGSIGAMLGKRFGYPAVIAET